MQVEVDELQSICEILFAHLKEQGVEAVDIPVDYYWNITRKQVYDPYQQPTEYDVGQLSDDWHELQRLLKSESEPLGYCFVWLAAILRAVGENVPT